MACCGNDPNRPKEFNARREYDLAKQPRCAKCREVLTRYLNGFKCFKCNLAYK
jgi:hypothetical protein